MRVADRSAGTTTGGGAAAIELLGLAGARVLDAGCGFGRFAPPCRAGSGGRRRHLRRDRRGQARVPGPDLPRRRPDAAAAAGAARLRRPGQHLLKLRLRRDGRGGRSDAARLPRALRPGRQAGDGALRPGALALRLENRRGRGRPRDQRRRRDARRRLLERDAARPIRLGDDVVDSRIRCTRPTSWSGWPSKPASATSSATATSRRPEAARGPPRAGGDAHEQRASGAAVVVDAYSTGARLAPRFAAAGLPVVHVQSARARPTSTCAPSAPATSSRTSSTKATSRRPRRGSPRTTPPSSSSAPSRRAALRRARRAARPALERHRAEPRAARQARDGARRCAPPACARSRS